MNKLTIALLVCCTTVAARAQAPAAKPAAAPAAGDKTAAAPAGADAMAAAMAMTKPGPNQDALKPYVHNVTSTGTMVAGAMGPGSPETPTKGKATCKWTTGNMWAVCDIEDTTGTGKQAMKWMGHWVFGWDNVAKAYRGVMVDNFGMAMRMKGTLDGTKMTWESMDELKVPGMPSKMRITEDAADAKNIKFTEEAFADGKWALHATATHKMAGGGK
jgi:hypothetical protein